MNTLYRRGIEVVLLFVLGLVASSCSLGFQESVRSAGTLCSNSRVWFIADASLAGAAGYVAATQLNEGTAFIPAGVLLASAAIGVYKRRNCIDLQESAAPEQWASDRRRAKRKVQEQAAQEREALARRAVAVSRARAIQSRAQADARAADLARRDAYDRENPEARRPAPPSTSTRRARQDSPSSVPTSPQQRPTQGPPAHSTIERRFRPANAHSKVKGGQECKIIFQDEDPNAETSSKYLEACFSCVRSGGGYWMIRGGKAPVCGCLDC